MDTVARLMKVEKAYGKKVAVDGLDLTLARGRVVGLLGLNGSGKTTTMRLIAGLLRADRGALEVLGEDPWRLTASTRRRVGYLSEKDFPFPHMTLKGALAFVGSLQGGLDDDYTRRLCEILDAQLDVRYSSLSRGNQRRFQLVVALAPKPELLLLDDPAQGLDVTVRGDLVHGLIPLLEAGRSTVLFSSHVMSDVERLADEVAIVHRGRVLLHAELDALKERSRQVIVPRGADIDIGRIVLRRSEGAEERWTVLDVDLERLDTLRAQRRVLDERSLGLEELFLDLVEEQKELAPR